MEILLKLLLGITISFLSWLVCSLMTTRGFDIIGSLKLTGIYLAVAIVFVLFGWESMLGLLFVQLVIAAFVMMPMWEIDEANDAFKILVCHGVISMLLNFLLAAIIK